MTNSIPVLIVGAGPTGLSMAIELERFGIPFRIIDKSIKPVSTSNALAVQPRTLEVWDDLGLITSALARGNRIDANNIFFSKTECLTINLNHIDSLYPFILALSQHHTEALMLEYLREKNIPIEMSTDLIDIYEETKGVTATLKHENGTNEKIHANWLIACDGGRSLVRTKLNIAFPGKELSDHFVLADLKIKSEMKKNQVYGFMGSKDILFIIHFDNEYSRIIANVTDDPELHEAKSLTLSQIQRLISERSFMPMEIEEPIWTSGFWLHERMINQYRHNRIFFAGDAAHIHSPVGGQGMNTGIQDANNLAWKLALVIQNKLNPDVLSTYHTERSVVAKAVLNNSTTMTKIVTLKNSFLCKLRNFLLNQILRFPRIQKAFAMQITELSIQYKNNLLVDDGLKTQSGPKAGTRFLDVKFEGDQRLMDFVRGAHFCLLAFVTEREIETLLKFKEAISKRYAGLIQWILIGKEGDFSQWMDQKIVGESAGKILKHYSMGVYLIRPDKYIGYRGSVGELEKLGKYLENIYI